MNEIIPRPKLFHGTWLIQALKMSIIYFCTLHCSFGLLKRWRQIQKGLNFLVYISLETYQDFPSVRWLKQILCRVLRMRHSCGISSDDVKVCTGTQPCFGVPLDLNQIISGNLKICQAMMKIFRREER